MAAFAGMTTLMSPRRKPGSRKWPYCTTLFLLLGLAGCTAKNNGGELPWQILWYGAMHRWEYDSHFISGDFDDDGHRDYIIRETHSGAMRREENRIAFLRRGFMYKPYYITGTATPPFDQTLDIAGKGSSFTDLDSKSKIYCENDCIRVVQKSGIKFIFKFENGEFRKTETND